MHITLADASQQYVFTLLPLPGDSHQEHFLPPPQSVSVLKSVLHTCVVHLFCHIISPCVLCCILLPQAIIFLLLSDSVISSRSSETNPPVAQPIMCCCFTVLNVRRAQTILCVLICFVSHEKQCHVTVTAGWCCLPIQWSLIFP